MASAVMANHDLAGVIPSVLDGAKPNNFELANAIVIKGRVEGSSFHASEILTKCPSKYEAAPAAAARKNL